VHRTASLIHRNVGAIPEAGDPAEVDVRLLEATRAGFREVGDLLATHRQKQALGEAMRVVGEATSTRQNRAVKRATEPGADEDGPHVAAQGRRLPDALCCSCRTRAGRARGQRADPARCRADAADPKCRRPDGGPGYAC
jgi:hypothetical protein